MTDTLHLRKAIQSLVGARQDGVIGPDTLARIYKAIAKKDWEPSPPSILPAPEHQVWPRETEAELTRFYGKVGTNQISIVLPYPLVLDWDKNTVVRTTTCHKLVAEPLIRIFEKTLAHYGISKIKDLGLDQYGGCLNVRKKRGGSSWSVHAWGAAVDIDPDRNTLHETHKTARLARPEYEAFWNIVESEGAVSLGRARDYDWMHFQFARL